MQQRPFRQVDVFTDIAYRGNPLAVVLQASDLSTEEMQDFARWTNLSETAFLLPARSDSADFRVRIFTPGGELPFAGHPTLGSCHAWLEAGGRPRERDSIVQECELGLVRTGLLFVTGSGDTALYGLTTQAMRVLWVRT